MIAVHSGDEVLAREALKRSAAHTALGAHDAHECFLMQPIVDGLQQIVAQIRDEPPNTE